MTLILTLGFDPDSFARLDALRVRHFPPDRNFIPAHLTLFQQLPDDRETDIAATLARVLADTAPLPFTASGILDFGKGAAIDLKMPGFPALHGHLCRQWDDFLTQSDRSRRKPHVTVQNKVDRDTARDTLATLRAAHAPWQGVADRLLLWHYRGGPWERAARFDLKGHSDA